MRLALATTSLLLACACQTPRGASRVLPPLAHEGEVLLYLQPLPADAERLELNVDSLGAVAGQGDVRPLELVRREVGSSDVPHQALLARGRLAPGNYQGFVAKVARAALRREAGRRDLLVAAEPYRLEGPFTVKAGEATVLWATLRPRESLNSRFGFSPAVTIAPPPLAVPELVGFCTGAGTNDVTVFDRVRHHVLGVIPTGRSPRGIAVDTLASRAFVAAEGAGEIEVIDVAAGRIVGRAPLDPGDAPRDVALTPDGRVLVVVNRSSNTASFLDPASWVQRTRVRTGDLPSRVIVDRSGKRGYVLNSTSNDVTVLDLDYGAVVGSFRTESEPVAAAVDGAGTVLYVVLRGSPHLIALSLPDLTVLRRVFVGIGATSVVVDPRTSRIYVGAPGRSGIQVFEPTVPTPVGLIDVPDSVSDMVIMNTERTLLALMPGEQAVAAVDLTTGKVTSLFDVGGAPHQLAVTGATR